MTTSGIMVLLNPAFVINTTDLTGYITEIGLEQSWEEVDTTAFGGGGAKTRVAGLSDGKVTANWQQSYGGSAVEGTLLPLMGQTASFTLQPNEGAVSITNPQYAGAILMNGWSPIKGKVGELVTFSVTWPTTGVISRTN